MLIETLKTKGGQPFPISGINVLIGPSGSGKTQALLDIARLLTRQDPSDPTDVASGDKVEELPPTVVLEDGQFVSPLTEQRLLRGLHVEERAGREPLVQGLAATLDRAEHYVVRRETWNVIQRPVLSVSSVAKTELGGLLAMRAAYLPAIGRRNLVAPVGAISPLEAPHSLLQRLQWNSEGIETELNRLVGELFSCQIVVDVAQHTEVSLRVLPADTVIPEFDSIRDRARFLSDFPTVDRFQDGVANFVAIGTTVLLNGGSVVLIDVPEMGLHPDSCRHLGRWLADTATRCEVQLFLATHSSELIEGLQEEQADVSAIRLRRSGEAFVANPVPSKAMNGLKTSPYFLAQRSIASIFSDAVVITDNEIERSVYRAAFLDTSPAAHRLTFFQTYGLVGLDSVLETIADSGLRHVVVSNLELIGMRSRFHRMLELITGGTPPPGLLASRDKIAARIEEANTQQTLAANTQEVEVFLDQFGKNSSEEATPLNTPDDRAKRWRSLREKGLAGLDPELRNAIDELGDELKNLGIFLAPVGWVRKWFDVESRSKWFEEALWKMQREGAPAPLGAFLKEVLFYLGHC
jgi:hypothetical protein